MSKNPYYKTTPGVPVEVVIGKTVTAQTTMKDFQASGAVGEYGLFGTDGAMISIAAALSAANKKKQVYFAYKPTAERVYRTSPMLAGDMVPALKLYAAAVNEVATCTNAGVGTVNVLQEVTFKVIETTPDNQNLPTWRYSAKLAAGETAAWTDIAAQINAANEEEFFTAVGNASGITITGTDPNRHFRLAAEILPTAAAPNDTGVYYNSAITTRSFQGAGLLDQVQDLYESDQIYGGGITHQYTDGATPGINPEDMGLPAKVSEIATATSNFDTVAFSAVRTEHSPTPHGQTQRTGFIFIAVPSGQGAAINTAFA